jgi:hypothetical protein
VGAREGLSGGDVILAFAGLWQLPITGSHADSSRLVDRLIDLVIEGLRPKTGVEQP